MTSSWRGVRSAARAAASACERRGDRSRGSRARRAGGVGDAWRGGAGARRELGTTHGLERRLVDGLDLLAYDERFFRELFLKFIDVRVATSFRSSSLSAGDNAGFGSVGTKAFEDIIICLPSVSRQSR